MGMAIAAPRYTIEDLEEFPDDGNRYELLDGVLLVTPQAALVHQGIASRLQGILIEAVQKPGYAHVLGPGAVVRPPNTQLQPDLLVIPSRFPLSLDWKKVTEQWLAVEILSRSSRVYDRDFKRDAYFALGVREVWIVDPRKKMVEVSKHAGGFETISAQLEWNPPVAGVNLLIDLHEVFAGID